MSLVKWVDGYYDNKADVPLEKIGDGKDLEFLPLAVVLLADLAEVVDGLKYIEAVLCERKLCGHFTPEEIRQETQRLLAKLEGKG